MNKTFTFPLLLALIWLADYQPLSAQSSSSYNIRYFAHTGGTYSNNIQQGNHDTDVKFDQAVFTIMSTASFGEKLTFLGEFTLENSFNATEKELEFKPNLHRLFMKYNFSDYLAVMVGKSTLPVGYWNNNFYRGGEITQPTIGRPSFLQENSYTHITDYTVMLEGGGISRFNMGYSAYAFTGRASQYLNTLKGVGFGLDLHAEPIESLRIGYSYKHDPIPADPLHAQALSTLGENGMVLAIIDPASTGLGITTNREGIYRAIFQNHDIKTNAFSVVYMDGMLPLELITEYHMSNWEANDPDHPVKQGVIQDDFFFYAGYHIKKLTPYLTYSYEQFIVDYPTTRLVNEYVNAYGVGMRYSFTPNAIVKLEYKYSADYQAPFSGNQPVPSSNFNHWAGFQIAVGF